MRLDRITDAVHAIHLSETRSLEIALDEFERRFPQAFAAIYLGNLPTQLRPRELGFWLLNHGAFNTPQVAKRNDFGMVVVIDYTSSECSISLGYALESLVPTAKLDSIVRTLAQRLGKHQLGRGLLGVIDEVSRVLARSAKEENRLLSHHFGAPGGMGLRSLRGGHSEHPERASSSSRPLGHSQPDP